MDKLATYRTCIEKALADYVEESSPDADVETQIIIDRERDHYQLVNVGWRGERRVYGNVLHLDIKGGKIWIQFDGTEEGIANRLVALGLAKSEVVLAFHSPYKRQFTEFAVG